MKFDISNLCSHFWILNSHLHIFYTFLKCQCTGISDVVLIIIIFIHLMQGLLGWKLCDKGPFKYTLNFIFQSRFNNNWLERPLVIYTICIHSAFDDAWLGFEQFLLLECKSGDRKCLIMITNGLWKCCVYDVCYLWPICIAAVWLIDGPVLIRLPDSRFLKRIV